MFKYDLSDDDGHKREWQTSGNFVHSTQTIIDDCYNISGKYKSQYKEPDGVPAHYWYIKGQVYVYNQNISAYTGAPNAYSEKVEIPLTITAASHGTMKLLNIQPNYYAYYKSADVPLEEGQKLVINDITYYKNDPIDYWTYSLLNPAEKSLFVKETYVVKEDCKIGSTDYKAGQVLSDEEYETLMVEQSDGTYLPPTVTQEYVDDDGTTKTKTVDFGYIFRSSNNMSHDTGYILTYKVNNPTSWDTWYTSKSGSPSNKNQTGGSSYEDAPTYRLKVTTGGEVLGQREYAVGNVIAKDIYDTYDAISSDIKSSLTGQAEFGPASIVTSEVTIGNDTWFAGSTVSAATAATLAGYVEDAYISTHTIQLSPTEYVYLGSKLSASERSALLTKYADNVALKKEIEDDIVPAYICTTAGLYGGNYYEAGKNYRGLEAWSSMSATDRDKFVFNYDALDVLIDPTYGGAQGNKYQYDSSDANLAGAEANEAHYSLQQPVDYTASYNPTISTETLTLGSPVTIKRNGSRVENVTTIQKDDELSREVFEQKLHNEQRYYAAINVKEAGTYYVVKESFQIGNTPYAVGTTISSASFGALSDEDKAKIAKLTFTTEQEGNQYYFCRETYQVANSSLGVKVDALSGVYASDATNSVSGTFSKGEDVPVGAVINHATYTSLVENNQQKDFVIHGIAPTETSTFYVSRNSDISDLSQEKIITVVYQYDYDENDASGNVTPVSERHVVNIHIKFKSGVPTVEDIKAPQIVLPGSRLGMREPNVTPGAYEVTGGGWELFQKKRDAESHDNGVEYSPLTDKLFYYQNDYYLAYYATTYLGKTYSNHVQVSVANYHDLAAVMGDKDHHYYIDHKDVDREPKIYINDYKTSDPTTSKNGLDLLKNLIDLTYVVNNDATGNPKPISSGELEGHMPLDLTHADKPMRGGEYLKFFLRSDQDHTGSPWTPIANDEGKCFRGVLHGDGYTVNGLSNSLFNHLCGDVYNLGVTGSFTGAGIAEDGEGYMENCWVYNSSTEAKTSKPVYGNPTITTGDESTRPIRIVNCYYMEENNAENKYTNHTGSYGIPTRKPAQSFHNGEVAYDLNGFYLNKRYYDNASLSGTKTAYQYFKANADGTLPTKPTTANYLSAANAQYGNIGYVEERLKDGDFIYAGGEIPEGNDERFYIDEEDNSGYYPIWPDDYLFFGQMLTYGYAENRPYQPLPSHINKSGNRLTTTATSINRVFRAPAYFRSSDMGVAHYNPYAVFAAESADKTYTVYPGMTAIDFTGTNDGAYNLGLGSVGKSGSTTQGFYPPLLDNDGLTFFRNADLTKNLLVYTPVATDDANSVSSTTYSAVNTALSEPVYTEGTDNPGYRTVAIQDASSVYGHQVVKNSSKFEAQGDHFLVDKQEFYAPLSYDYVSRHRMFYQRTPENFVNRTQGWEENFVNRTQGWEGISLPFGVELVTTQTKGEITHFYGSSTSSYNNTGTKLGHEYWLRAFEGNLQQKKDEDGVYTADFNYPAAGSEGDKEYTNTYLWDYYYSAGAQLDRNADKYQTYYKDAHTFDDYGYAVAAKPYIIGFPSDTYYEFDLSGSFEAHWTAAEPAKLPKQVVTFASWPNAHINESDNDTGDKEGDYIFTTNYLKQTFPAGTADTYTLNAAGSSYSIIPATSESPIVVEPFRPYFTKATASSRTRGVEQIVFGQADTSFGIEKHGDPSEGELAEGLSIYVQKNKIVVTSNLHSTTDVRIMTPAGVTTTLFTIRPGETIQTRVIISGVYIVQTTDGRYTKKLGVKNR